MGLLGSKGWRVYRAAQPLYATAEALQDLGDLPPTQALDKAGPLLGDLAAGALAVGAALWVNGLL